MRSVLITGTSRGIGLALAVELLKDPNNFVIATARKPSESSSLQNLQAENSRDRLTTVALDVADAASVTRAVEEVAALLPSGLDCLISNAGDNKQPIVSYEDCDLDLLQEDMNINAIAPIRVVRAFLPLLRQGVEKKVVFVSSNLGSLEISPMLAGLGDAYSMTKAALNMLAAKWGSTLRQEGIAVVLLHPGWVETDMGNAIADWIHENAPSIKQYTAQESATSCVRVINQAKLEDGVKLLNFDGTQLPW